MAQIESDTVNLEEIEIIGTHIEPFSIDIISLEDEDELSNRDIGDFLRGQANISGIRKGGVGIDPVVRGFRYDQINVLFDQGLHLEGGCPNRMDPVASHIEAEDIEKIEIARGPYVLRYGPTLGALIRLQTIRPVFFDHFEIHGEGRYAFETNWNGQKEYFRIFGGGQKFAFTASGGQKSYGSYLAGNEQRYMTSFHKWHGSLTTAVKLTSKSVLEADYRYNAGEDVRYPALPMDEKSDRTHIGKLAVSGQSSKNWFRSYSLLVGYSSVDHHMDNHLRPNYSTMQASTQVKANTWSANALTNANFGDWQVTPGVDFERIEKDGTKTVTMKMEMGGVVTKSTKYFNVWNEARLNNYGVFTEVKRTSESFDVVLSIRADINQANSKDTFLLKQDDICYFCETYSLFFNGSFGAGLTWKISSPWSLSVAFGRGTRSPSVLERFIKLLPVGYDPFDYLGNPQLKPEKNHQLDVSAMYTTSKIGSLKLTGFISFINDYITGKRLPPSLIKPTTQGVLGVKQFINMNYAYLTGFEFTYQSPAEYKLGGQGSIAMTYGIMTEAVDYITVNNQVVDEEVIENDPIPEIPPLELNLSAYYYLLEGKLVPEISIRAAAAQKHISESYDESESPSWFVTNFTVRYSPLKWISFQAGINNIFDVAYYDHLNRRIIGTTENLYEPGRVFFIAITGKF